MPRYYCDYCDVFLTHDNVREYYQEIGHEKAQNVIDSITKAYENQPVMLPLPGMFPPLIPGMPPMPISGVPGPLPPHPGMLDTPLPPPIPGMPFPPPFVPPSRLNLPFPGGFVPPSVPPPGISQIQPSQQSSTFLPQNMQHSG